MREALFGSWGTALADGAFACAVAGLGVLYGRAQRAPGEISAAPFGVVNLANALQQAAGDRTLVRWRYPGRQTFARNNAMPSPDELATAWQIFRKERHPGLRLLLDTSNTAPPPVGVGAAHLTALLGILANHDARVDAAFVEWKAEQRASWGWPLRLGLFEGEASEAIGTRIHELYPARDLARVLRFSRHEARCDIAVLPGLPRTSLAHILMSPAWERAGLVLFTAGLGGELAGQSATLKMIAREMRASAFAALARRPKDPSQFINEIINHLSHDMPLDVAIFMAARGEGAEPPIMFCDPEFVERTNLSSVAHALARTLEAAGNTSVDVPPALSQRIGIPAANRVPAYSVGSAMKNEISEFRYAGESHEATMLARAKPALEASLTAANVKKRDPRFVQAQIKRTTTNGTRHIERALVAGERHQINVRIGPHDGEWINPKNRVAFPDELLPMDEEEHIVTVVLSEPNHVPEPLVKSVRMKQTGPSDVAEFELVPRGGQPQFRARITVAHRNRVLQTAIISTRVLAAGEAPRPDDAVTVEVEAIVRPLLQDLAQRSRFDVALVLNHTPQGQPAMLSLADNHAVLRGMEAIKVKIDAISNRLSVVAAAAKRYAKGLDAEDSVDLLRYLADKGRSLYDYLVKDQVDPVLGERLRNDEPIQIVSLSPDSYFPAEFAYEFDVPAPDAQVCPAAKMVLKEALKSGSYAKICTAADHHAGSDHYSRYVCPFGFWGLRRVIERHAWRLVKDAPAGDYVLQAEPSSARNVLAFASATLFAASNHVEDEKVGAVKALVDRLRGVLKTPVERATSWREWRDLVREPGPPKTALIALPHVEGKADGYGDTEYYLEIGGDMLKAAALARKDVLQTDDAPAPLVILLGCNTAVPQAAIDSVVGQFRRNGAGIVVGTVASVLGSHASAVAQEIAAQIVDLGAGEKVPFGDLLLAVRRRALGNGIVMAMCIAGFGDADWLIAV